MAAAPSGSWQPKEEGFKEICGLLEQQISHSSDKSQIWHQLQHYSQFPDFNNYLAFILARAEVLSLLSCLFTGFCVDCMFMLEFFRKIGSDCIGGYWVLIGLYLCRYFDGFCCVCVLGFELSGFVVGVHKV